MVTNEAEVNVNSQANFLLKTTIIYILFQLSMHSYIIIVCTLMFFLLKVTSHLYYLHKKSIGSLASVRVIALGKEGTPEHW
jgi:hypothetical protein